MNFLNQVYLAFLIKYQYKYFIGQMGGCMSEKHKKQSILNNVQDVRKLPRQSQAQFKYPDLNQQKKHLQNVGPSKLQPVKVSHLPPELDLASNIANPSANHGISNIPKAQSKFNVSKLPNAQSVVNGVSQIKEVNQSHLHHQQIDIHRTQIPTASNVKVSYASNIERVAELPQKEGPNYSKIPEKQKENDEKIPSDIADVSKLPQGSDIPEPQNPKPASQIKASNRSLEKHHVSQFKNYEKDKNIVSNSIPKDESSIDGMVVDMKSGISSGLEAGITRSNIGFKERSGIEQIHASEAYYKKKGLQAVEEEEEAVNDQNVKNYSIPKQNFKLSYSLA